ncbi:MAG TPA: NUDIX hydrolase [Anaeromyxobacteraceae bacterium]|nr:NUDIX hydrolase [Anaeromyxobacteraceae bacterium]
MKPIEAAGGIVWRPTRAGPRLVLVHRPRYRDWSLPKGKLERGETYPEAALREVLEETGCEARLGPLAGAALYRVGPRPKVVVYWHMELLAEHPFEPGEEIDAIAWLSRSEALRRLDHESERRILSRRRPGARLRRS